MIIIGITGHIGAGKGTVVEYLTEIKGFKHFSARTFITKEIKRRGLPVDRDSMTLVSNDLRQTYSPSYIIESLYKEAKERGVDCIIESIRTPGEVDALRSIGHFFLLAVTADLPVRYQRVVLRAGVTDNISFETFVMQDEREAASTDPHKGNINECIRRADYVLNNNGSVQTLHKEIEDVFVKITKTN